MNMILKSAVAGVLALGASSAFAMGTPASNNSNLLLVVDNNTTNAFYILDTGISMNSLLPSSSLASGAVLDTSLAGITTTIAASATLQSFLAANPSSGDSWTLEGAQYPTSSANGVTKVVGNAKAAFTSQNGTLDPANVNAKQLQNLNGYIGNLNVDVGVGAFTGLLTSTEITGTGFTADIEGGKYGFFGGNDLGATGVSNSLKFFGFTGGGSTGILSSYVLGSATLAADGTLSIVGNGTVTPPTNPVPLPAAVWLFGSGLMGLVGVSRRRKTAIAPVAV
jgi:hypothetical protein